MESGEKKDRLAKKMVGKVVSAKMDKTIVVECERTFKHPLLGKIVRRKKKYKAHDADGAAVCGDIVEIQECAPFSKTKHMKLSNFVERSRDGGKQ